MPEYLLRCKNGHERWVIQPMVTRDKVACEKCHEYMWRKPIPVTVTWGGLKPSQGELNPEIQELVDTAPERRAKFEQEHEEHERATADDTN